MTTPLVHNVPSLNMAPETEPNVHKKRCCYKTVDFAMAASQNGVYITQGKCQKMI
jgi:hypothetical protein